MDTRSSEPIGPDVPPCSESLRANHLVCEPGFTSCEETIMPSVLVVDDSAIDRKVAGWILEKEAGFSVSYAGDGADAIRQIQVRLPDAVVSDLQMPEMDGLMLVAAIKQHYPLLPVILMTAQGSEDIAAEALRQGAASYVPKTALATNLGEVVSRVITSAQVDRGHSRLMNSLSECFCRFTLHNDPDLIEPLVNRLQEMLRCLPLADESERVRVGIALKHALVSGLYVGNLELPSEAENLFTPELVTLAQERSVDRLYASRRLVIEAQLTPQVAEFRIRHEGAGFEAAQLPDHPDVSLSLSYLARGWTLMKSILDEARISADGRTQTLVKHALVETELLFEE